MSGNKASTKLVVYKNAPLAAKAGNEKSVPAVCEDIRTLAALGCPVQYGQLRNSLTWEVSTGEHGPFNDEGLEPAPFEHKISAPPRQRKTRVKGYVGTNSDHWFPEFGTLRQIAQPFLRPAFDIVVRGATAMATIVKYGREAMVREFNIRREVFNKQ